MDAALRLDSIPVMKAEKNSFNPCFDGCRPATSMLEMSRYTVISVSILVLMDAALRLVIFDRSPSMDYSFNPCFDGCRPATLSNWKSMTCVPALFQSLF